MAITLVDSITDGTTTVVCNVLVEGRSRRAGALVSVRKVPGGDVVVLNRGGKSEKRRSFTVLLADSDALDDLEDLANEVCTLTYAEGTFIGILEDVSGGEVHDAELQQNARITLIKST